MSTKTLEAGQDGRIELEVNKLQSLIDADCEGSFGYQAVMVSGANKERESFKALLLAAKTVILSADSMATLRTRIKLTYGKHLESLKLPSDQLKTRVDNMTKDRLAILSNCHKLAAGGKKDDVVVHGKGFAPVEKLIKAHKDGGIKAFKKAVSDAVPAELKAAPRALTGAAGSVGSGNAGSGASKTKADVKAPSNPVVMKRSSLLQALDNVLHTIVKSDVFKPGSDAKLLALIAQLEDLVELELDAPEPLKEAVNQ